jgi:predicted GNAT family acetyltransferase
MDRTERHGIQLKLNDNGRGSFVIEENEERLAEMVIGINGTNLIVYHTEVSEKLKGQGVGPKMVENMVAYAREHKLKVVALCPFVNTLFKRNPERYTDVWNQAWR